MKTPVKRLGLAVVPALVVGCVAVSPIAASAAPITEGVLSAETRAYATDVSKRLAEEGSVLLENELKNSTSGEGSGEAALPLGTGAEVAVFGSGQNTWTTTSFYDGLDDRFTDIVEGLNASGVSVNSDLRNWYVGKTNNNTAVPDDVFNAAATSADAAVVVIQRRVTEGSEGTAAAGGYYLSDAEASLIDRVNAAFDNVIAVFNTGYVVDMQWLKDKHIDAAIHAGTGGNYSGNAVAGIIEGTLNPSGKLADTYAQSWTDYPSSSHWASSDGTLNGSPVVYYTDDVYVGYKYFETFDVPVTYEFGYGLSYTDFDWSGYSVTPTTVDAYQASVTVTNTGETAGKDVVELYFTPPIDNDSMSQIDTPSIQLIGYAKTDLLEPGESQTVTIDFDMEDLSLYSETQATYTVYAGQYQVKFGSSVRDIKQTIPVLNTATRSVKTVSNLMVPQTQIDVLQGTPQASAFEDRFGDVKRNYDASADSTNIAALPTNPVAVDVAAYNADKKGYSFYQVVSGEITMDEFLDDLTLHELASLVGGRSDVGAAATFDGVEIGQINSVTDKNVTGRTMGITSRDLFNMTMADRQETIGFYNEWGGATNYGFEVYPSNTVNAQTWNQPLISEYGKAIGQEAVDAGIDTFLGVSMNIHRNPLGGRNGEYFSEDPVLTGYSAAAVVNGVQSTGTAATLKHVAANNQETNRNTVNEQISERALREVYLKGYQIAVEHSSPQTIMTSYNKINGAWSAQNYDMQNGIFRGEWGWEGYSMTDWGLTPPVETALVSGQDLIMGSFPNAQDFYDKVKAGTITTDVLKENAARILEIVKTTRYYRDIEPFVQTTTALAASSVSGPGESLTLTATVSPAEATGSVEFFDGATSLGISDAAGGSATWTIDEITAGAHSFTAVFTPAEGVGYGSSTSAAVEVNVAALQLVPSVTPRALAGKVYLYVTVANGDSVAADITVTTPYGTKTFSGVQPGKSATVAFNSKLAAIPAGTVEVHGTAVGGTTSFSGSVSYSATNG